MPFFIATSYRNLTQDAVSFVDAGPDQQLICDPSGVLTAVVSGDLAGRVLLWEQISGSPVSFTSPTNQLSVTFNQFDFDDKTFRFTVDKNLPSERYDDITVFGSPTSIAYQSPDQLLSSSRINETIPVASLSVALESIPHTVVYCKDLSNSELVWTISDVTVPLIGFNIEFKLGGGAWTVEATTSPSSRVYVPLFTNSSYLYRVVAIRKTPNATYSVPSNYVNRTVLQDDVLTVNDYAALSTTNILTNTQITHFNVDTLKLVKKPPVIDDSQLSMNQRLSNSAVKLFTVQTLVLLTKPPVEIESHLTSQQQLSSSRITTFTVEDLTGGSVGG